MGDLSVEASKALRQERSEARRRNRGGIFVPATTNPLIDILLARDITGASPKRSKATQPSPDEDCMQPVSKRGNATGKSKAKPTSKSRQASKKNKVSKKAEVLKTTAGSSDLSVALVDTAKRAAESSRSKQSQSTTKAPRIPHGKARTVKKPKVIVDADPAFPVEKDVDITMQSTEHNGFPRSLSKAKLSIKLLETSETTSTRPTYKKRQREDEESITCGSPGSDYVSSPKKRAKTIKDSKDKDKGHKPKKAAKKELHSRTGLFKKLANSQVEGDRSRHILEADDMLSPHVKHSKPQTATKRSNKPASVDEASEEQSPAKLRGKDANIMRTKPVKDLGHEPSSKVGSKHKQPPKKGQPIPPPAQNDLHSKHLSPSLPVSRMQKENTAATKGRDVVHKNAPQRKGHTHSHPRPRQPRPPSSPLNVDSDADPIDFLS